MKPRFKGVLILSRVLTHLARTRKRSQRWIVIPKEKSHRMNAGATDVAAANGDESSPGSALASVPLAISNRNSQHTMKEALNNRSNLEAAFKTIPLVPPIAFLTRG